VQLKALKRAALFIDILSTKTGRQDGFVYNSSARSIILSKFWFCHCFFGAAL